MLFGGSGIYIIFISYQIVRAVTGEHGYIEKLMVLSDSCAIQQNVF
jgi:hypothetical protein